MRFIAVIVVVGFLIYFCIKSAKESRLKAAKQLQADRNHYRDLYKLTRRELETIVRTDGEGAAFTAQLALDECNTMVEKFTEQKELENA